jgi:SAM-dependent methyltransferase
MSELLIGCGNSRRKKLTLTEFEWTDLTTIDHDPNCGADIIHDLDETPWPLEDDSFDEVHAYCVLEHLGQQGDYKSFFRHFHEIWRVLKHGGKLFGFCPSYKSQWAWGDPSHTRVITPGSMMFLDQSQYEQQIGTTAMTDFRWLWKGDLRADHLEDDGERFTFILRAVKE